MTRHLPLSVFLTAMLVVFSSSGPTQAATIFPQPYAGPAFGLVSDIGLGQLVADDFSFATPVVVTDFHWWGGYSSTPDPAIAPADSWSLTFYPDLASLQSFSGGTVVPLTNLSRTFTGDFTPVGNAIFAYTADLVSPLALASGSYYALLFGDTGPQYSGWTTLPITGSPSWVLTVGGVWSESAYEQAFEITGYAVPEPATLLLLGTGLAAAGVRRRLKKRS